jgi:hypothetical protein
MLCDVAQRPGDRQVPPAVVEGDYAFNILNLESLSLRAYDFNPRAQAAYRKVGFKEAGRLRKAHFYGGEYHDILVMDLLAEEFGPSALRSVKSQPAMGLRQG